MPGRLQTRKKSPSDGRALRRCWRFLELAAADMHPPPASRALLTLEALFSRAAEVLYNSRMAVLARKIRVNVVSPGPVETPLTAAAHGVPELRQYVNEMVPLGRWKQAEEVARAVLFLASSEASYITGAELAVDGGLAQI
jgi:NAD(P)-dependent dehydrogenase (short-subunit alcohol dehydrogenase family)